MPRAKQRTPALGAHVLRAALALLEQEGVAAFTARRIAEQAGTSLPAVYELFGDKAGLLRAVFFEGFRLLRTSFDALPASDDVRADLLRVLLLTRGFLRARPRLSDLMFSQPFAAFDPGPAEQKAGSAVREFIVARVQRCVDAGLVRGDANDVAHVLLALVQGLGGQERAGWLGRSRASRERRWQLALDATLRGLAAAE